VARKGKDSDKSDRITPDADEAEIVAKPDAAEDPVEDTPAPVGDAGTDAEPETDALDQAPLAEPANEIAAVPAETPAWRGGALLAGGGVLAALIGFVFARLIAPDGWPIDTQTKELAAVRSQLEASQAEQQSLLQDQVKLTMRLSKAEGTLATISKGIEPLDGLADDLAQTGVRIDALEARPVVETTPDVGAEIAEALSGYRDQVETLNKDVAAATARADALEAEFAKLTGELGDRLAGAEALAQEAKLVERAVLAQGALAALGRAIRSGAPFTAELADLTGAADIPAPAALSAAAKNGVPTLAALQGDFPPAARAALADARSVDPDAGLFDRVGAFLSVQTGARSLTPREGDDPDAILSRAEQALREARVSDALSLVKTLPEDGTTAMADWIAAATSHADTAAAYDALVSTLSPN